MKKHASTTLTLAAQILGSHPAALRKAMNQFQIVERDSRRRRLIPNNVLALFRRTKTVSGYLYPHWIRTRDELIAAAAQIPPSEITDLAENRFCDSARHHGEDVGHRHHGADVGHHHHRGGGDG